MRLADSLTLPSLQARDGLRKSHLGLQKSLERIGSGKKINRAADDAAGLTIASKLEGQIRGLKRSITNAQDGISLLQAADGALSESQSIMNRMRELAIQSGDDALTSSDRFEIQKEVDQLVDEIDRIASTTEFNQKKLLDGSAGYRASTSNADVDMLELSGVDSSRAGSGSAQLNLQEIGTSQLTYSAILQRADNEEAASDTDRLKDLKAPVNARDLEEELSRGTILTLVSRRGRAEVRLDSETQIRDVVAALNSALKDDLGLAQAEAEFVDGRFRIDTRMSGRDGQVDFLAEQPVHDLLQLENKTDATQATYSITGDMGANRLAGDGIGASDTGHGVELLNPTSAYVRSFRESLLEVAYVEEAVFYLADTNVHGAISPGAAAAVSNHSEVVSITVRTGSYTMDQLVQTINDQISANVSAPARAPGVVASHDGESLFLTSTLSGSTAFISIFADNNTREYLGLSSGTESGFGGGLATVSGTRNISGGMITSADGSDRRVNLFFSDADGVYSNVNITTPDLGANVSLTTVQILNLYNNALNAQAGGLIQARMNGSNILEFYSTTGTGEDGGFYLAAGAGDLTSSIPSNIATTFAGAQAVMEGEPISQNTTTGFDVTGQIQFEVVDGRGRSSGPIVIGGQGVASADESFQFLEAQFVSVLAGSQFYQTDVRYRFDDRGRLEFYSLDTGHQSVVSLRALDDVSAARAYETFGLDFNAFARGTGEREFRYHVEDRRLGFQIGANQNQRVQFSIGDMSSKALGLQSLSVDSLKLATDALGRIDRAQQLISSQRAQMGALINRLDSSIRGLTQTTIDSQAGNSRIEDADLAQTTVELSRDQVLRSSGTSILSQAKSLSRSQILALLD